MRDLQIHEQVIYRKVLRGGLKQIKVGNITAFRDPERKVAVVSFPADKTRADIPVNQLESVRSRFGGRAVVQVNPARRGIVGSNRL